MHDCLTNTLKFVDTVRLSLSLEMIFKPSI